MKRPLDDVVALARQEFGADASRRVDWRAIDETLFARIEEQRRAEVAELARPRSRRWAYFGSAAMAVAATLGILVGKNHEPSLTRPTVVHADAIAGRISEVHGQGAVLVNGLAAAAGSSVRLGDSLETRTTEATLVRDGAASVVIEEHSRLAVKQVRETLVLALERGTIEARVTPVATGEAFAVDVADARIAVHGTVLRVSRAGDHAVVDLVEGVVSVGAAPRFGPVLGSLVTAPAHVEFSVSDPLRTLTVSHDQNLVRGSPVAASANTTSPARPDDPEPLRPRSEPSGFRSAAPAGQPGHVDSRGPANPPAVASGDVGATEAVEAAVLACMRERPRGENVTVVVNTTLYLDVGEDGAVRTARFDPPVVSDVNECAAAAIYKARFARPGPVAIPIEFKN
jgi:FecR-like protein